MTEPLRDASHAAAIRALEAHEREHTAAWADLRGDRVEDGPDMLLVLSGRGVAWTNGVFFTRLRPEEADRRVEEATEVFRAAGVPALWRVDPSTKPHDLSRTLERHGWRYHDDLPFMWADIETIGRPPGRPEGLVIERVTDRRTQSAWLFAMIHGFGMAEEEAEGISELSERSGLAPEGPWVRFAGLIDGRPVASSGDMFYGGVAGIYNVATLPDARHRGIGTAMTLAAIEHARHLGYRIAVLGTSRVARSLYERLGFREAVVVNEYLWKPPG